MASKLSCPTTDVQQPDTHAYDITISSRFQARYGISADEFLPGIFFDKVGNSNTGGWEGTDKPEWPGRCRCGVMRSYFQSRIAGNGYKPMD